MADQVPFGQPSPSGLIPMGVTPGDKSFQLLQGFDGLLSNLNALNQEVSKNVTEMRAGRMRGATYGRGGAAAAATAYRMVNVGDMSVPESAVPRTSTESPASTGELAPHAVPTPSVASGQV